MARFCISINNTNGKKNCVFSRALSARRRAARGEGGERGAVCLRASLTPETAATPQTGEPFFHDILLPIYKFNFSSAARILPNLPSARGLPHSLQTLLLPSLTPLAPSAAEKLSLMAGFRFLAHISKIGKKWTIYNDEERVLFFMRWLELEKALSAIMPNLHIYCNINRSSEAWCQPEEKGQEIIPGLRKWRLRESRREWRAGELNSVDFARICTDKRVGDGHHSRSKRGHSLSLSPNRQRRQSYAPFCLLAYLFLQATFICLGIGCGGSSLHLLPDRQNSLFQQEKVMKLGF